MTNKEAIEILQEEHDYCQEMSYVIKALEMAIEALEKQIPYKVEEKRYIDTYCKCGRKFSKHHGDGYYSIPYENMTKFCPACGQALDWSDTE